METIEKLTTSECIAAKEMWSEIFYEDPEKFTEYYFREKMPDNTGYGLKEEGRLRAMLFLTPYMARILSPDRQGNLFRDVPLCYIVGVGTKKEYRHRGYMDRLLRAALADLYEAEQPFTFLMPADPAIYTPYQFRYIYERPEFSVQKWGRVQAEPMPEGGEAVLAAFAERELEGRYQLFLKRDPSYYKRQKRESLAQNGDIYLWQENGELAGFYLYAEENGKAEIQEALVAEHFAGKKALDISDETKPVIMARITNVSAMLSLMRLAGQEKEETVSLILRVADPLLPGNNGTFLWTVGKKESTIALLDEADEVDACVGIEGLAQFLFGKKDARDVMCGGRKGKPLEDAVSVKLSCIEPLSRVCINEIV